MIMKIRVYLKTVEPWAFIPSSRVNGLPSQKHKRRLETVPYN